MLAKKLEKKDYFVIIDKDKTHPKKPFFDMVAYDLVKDNIKTKEISYLNKPFFTGLVQLANVNDLTDKMDENIAMKLGFDITSNSDNEKTAKPSKYFPFKFWKKNISNKKSNINTKKEITLKILSNPDTFRDFIQYAVFIVIGDELNKPRGQRFKKSQVIESEASDIQLKYQQEYLDSLEPVHTYIHQFPGKIDPEKERQYIFCNRCKHVYNKYTLLDENTRFRNQAFWVCRDCAGKEVIHILKNRKEPIPITPAIKIYLRDILKKYHDVAEVSNIFRPNFDILKHPEATLVGIEKRTREKNRKKLGQITIQNLHLPAPLQQYYVDSKIKNLLPAQIMSVNAGLMEEEDLLIVSATSSGKTMIGELSGFSKILKDKLSRLQNSDDQITALLRTKSRAKMLYLVPIVALASMRHSEYKILQNYGIKCALKVGVSHISKKDRNTSKREFGNLQTADIVIATYEAIDIMMRSAHPYLLNDFKTIIIDEIQMLADPERGFILDGLIGRLRLYLPNAQMLYLSATISDPQGLAKHLSTTLVHYKERPVDIERHLVFSTDDSIKKKYIKQLVQDEFSKTSKFGFKGQTIIFTNSRKKTQTIADYLYKNRIRASAYHGGLNYGQRKRVEKDFIKQKIAAVVTTAALAAGVDFPASMVIFHDLIMGIKELTVADFEQMSGRAGRFKKHDLGKVYLLPNPGKSASNQSTDDAIAMRLLKGKIEPLHLILNEDALYRECLATIAMYSKKQIKSTGITKPSLERYQSFTYNNNYHLGHALKFLRKHKFAQLLQIVDSKNKNETRLIYRTTQYGKAVAESYFSLKNSIEIRDELLAPLYLIDEDGEKIELKPPEPMKIAIKQNLPNNVYITNGMMSTLSKSSNSKINTNNLFSNAVLSLTSSESMGKNSKSLNRGIFTTLQKWFRDIFNCECEDAPYCNCGKENVVGLLIDYRLSGFSVEESIAELRNAYEIQMYSADVISLLESIIYSLLSIQKIGKALKLHPIVKEKIHEINHYVAELIGK